MVVITRSGMEVWKRCSLGVRRLADNFYQEDGYVIGSLSRVELDAVVHLFCFITLDVARECQSQTFPFERAYYAELIDDDFMDEHGPYLPFFLRNVLVCFQRSEYVRQTRTIIKCCHGNHPDPSDVFMCMGFTVEPPESSDDPESHDDLWSDTYVDDDGKMYMGSGFF